MLLVALVVLYVAALIAARLDVGRDFIKGWLEKQLGAELAIGGTSMALPFEIIIDRVESKGFDFGLKPGFKAREVRIALENDCLDKIVT